VAAGEERGLHHDRPNDGEQRLRIGVGLPWGRGATAYPEWS